MQEELRHKLDLAVDGENSDLITVTLTKREALLLIAQIEAQLGQIESLRGAVRSLIAHPLIRAAAEVARLDEQETLGGNGGGHTG